MRGFTFALAFLTCLTSVAYAQGGACNFETSGLPVVDMCEGGNWTLGRVYISVSSTTMGNNSRCTCTLSGKTPGQNTRTYIFLERQGTSEAECQTGHSTTVTWPPAADGSGGGSFTFTCNSPIGAQVTSPNSTKNVTLTQLRSGSSGVFNYCLRLQGLPFGRNNIELTCQSEMELSASNSTSSFSFTSAVTMASTAASASSSSSSSSVLPTSPALPSTPSVALTTSDSGAAATSGTEVTEGVSNMSENASSASIAASPSILTAVVAVAVVGWLLVLVLAVLVLLLCLRLRRQPKSSSASGTDNSAYTSLSDVTRSYPRADPNYSVIQSQGSSSQPGGSDAADPRGVYEAVEGDNSAVGGQGGERGREAASGTYCNA